MKRETPTARHESATAPADAALDWENLRHFGVLAGTLNLARASRQLHCSEATVMRRVRSLETALGVSLFVRRRDGHQLTDAGIRLQAAASDTQELLHTAAQDLRGQDREARGRVRITTTEVVAQWILLPHLVQFSRSWPQLTVALDASPHALDLTQDHETIAVRMRRPTRGPFVIRRLGAIEFGLYTARSSAGVGKTTTQAPWQPDAPYLGWTGPFSEIRLAGWLRLSFANRNPVAELSSMQAQMDACVQGLGVCALPSFLARREPRLVALTLPADQDKLTLEAWLVIPKAVRQTARVRAVVKMIEEAFVGFDTD
jgi:DNA-binding transcriptional LysR family regulator